jgi:hypothetical protein
MTQKYGRYEWTCPLCHKVFTKDTPQGLGLAKENHQRGHRRGSANYGKVPTLSVDKS